MEYDYKNKKWKTYKDPFASTYTKQITSITEVLSMTALKLAPGLVQWRARNIEAILKHIFFKAIREMQNLLNYLDF